MTALAADRRALLARAAVVALPVGLWFSPVPEGLVPAAWHLFALFVAAIASVVIGAFPILTSSVLALAAAVLTGTLAPAKAYSGFANGTILLIVVAFLVARAVVKCGLGERLGHLVVSAFGRSTLGLGYSIFLVDGVIAPAFPEQHRPLRRPLPPRALGGGGGGSPPGRGGAPSPRQVPHVLGHGEPDGLVGPLVHGHGREPPRPGDRPRLRPRDRLRLLVRGVLDTDPHRDGPPAARPLQGHWPRGDRHAEAPRAARRALAELGRLRPHEKIVAATFAGMVGLWASASTLGLDSTAVAFLGLGVLLATGVLTLGDIAKEGDVLATFIWFAVLFTLSGQLNELGFMGYLGERLAGALGGLSAPLAGVVLVVAYVLLHYLFVSQTAHLLALLGVFLDVGVKLGVPVALLAFLLLFATNFFSANTPQGSSANLLFAGSGYLSQGELYKLGALTTAFNLVLYLVVGIPWLVLVTR